MKTVITIPLFIAAILFVTLSYAQSIEFEQYIVDDAFIDGYDVSAADIDQDGHIDILACRKGGGGEACWYRNNGFSEFTRISLKQGFAGARSIRAADLNNNQEIDIVCAAWQVNDIVYFENTGDEIFVEHMVDNDFKGAHTIDLKDVNGDGNIDILCSGWDYYGHNGEIAWWENDGQDSITWTKHLISDRFQQSPFIYGEDMDNDDDIDVVACGEENDEVLWWENDGSGEFISENMVDSNFSSAHTVIARDVDTDGDMDILGAAYYSNKLVWYENDSSQQFEKHTLQGVAGALWLDAVDLDNDGDNDLIAAGMNSSYLYWYENDGNQEFTRWAIDGGFTSGFSIVPVNMDNDGDVDLLAVGRFSNKISWFENQLESPNLLNNPESVVYDSVFKRYLVSNCGDGNIIQIDCLGQQDYFNTELTYTLGLHIVGDTLFVSSNEGVYSGIVGFLLSTGEIVFHVDIPEKQLLNDITSDLAGNLYVTDCDANKIFKVRVADMTYTTFVDSGLGYPNGILYDIPNNRLLVLNCLLPNRPLISVNLEDSTVTTVVETNINSIDGLTDDNNGNFYFSSWSTDKVYRYDESFTNPPEVVSSGHTNPADIFYNKLNNILAIPNFSSNSVDFVSMSVTGFEEYAGKSGNEKYGFLIYPNPFSHSAQFNYTLEYDSRIELSVYDITGKEIKTLVSETKKEGHHNLIWKGKDNSNQAIKPGVYFCKLKVNNEIVVLKLIKSN